MWNNTPPSKEHEYDEMEKDCGDMTNFRRPPYYIIQKKQEEAKADKKAESRIKTRRTDRMKKAKSKGKQACTKVGEITRI